MKTKLLIVVHRLNFGGVQKSLLTALEALDYDRFDVTLYVRENRVDLLPQIDPRVTDVVVNDDKTRYYRKPRAVLLWLLIRLCALLRKDPAPLREKLDRFVIGGKLRYEKKRWFSNAERWDIAVAYKQGRTAELVSSCVSASHKIVFWHGSTDELHALHEAIFSGFDRIVAVNAGCADVLRGLYPESAGKITYLENYVDAPRVREAARAFGVDRPEGKAVLCSCGRFTPVKGFDLAVETAALLRDRGLSFLWYFVGDGPERAALEKRIADTGLTDRIRITGMLENPYPYIAGCDVYVQPSREEAHPLSVIEALLLCRPVVTTPTVGGSTLVRDRITGLIAGFDAGSLADRIALLLEDAPLRETMVSTLTDTDRSSEQTAFRDAWRELLTF